ncbi:MAG TPA: DUF2508 family protein [Firmicutes bacterium]|nr:DUF2508 family protein [Bacillota bacterium]
MKTTPEFLLYADVVTVKEARDDWQLAQTYFAWVSDPDLVDFAIFWERAARLRYVYLLQCLRKEGYSLSPTEVIQLAVRQIS